MHIEIDSGFEHHPLAAELVEFHVEVYVRLRPLYECTTHRFETLDEFPGYSAYHQIVILGKDADRRHVAYGCHSSQEAVALHEGRPGPLTGSGYGRNETGRASAHDNRIVRARKRSETPDLYSILLLRAAGKQFRGHCNSSQARHALLEEEPSADISHNLYNANTRKSLIFRIIARI